MRIATTETLKDRFIIAAVLLSVVYNAVLAIINAHVMRLGFAHVAMSEVLILALALFYLLRHGLRQEDFSLLCFLMFTLLLALYVSALNGKVYIDYFRNILIIFCFAALGTRANDKTVRTAFHLACLAVMLVLVCEIVSLQLYAGIFRPGSYFEATRGLKQPDYDGSGLFGNALGFKGRLTFGLIGHRASSLFLEQVSLSNFAGVMMMYCLFFWPELKRPIRLLLLLSIALILLTTASRTMLIFSAVCLCGYFVFPYIPKILNLLVMPLILLAALVIFMLKPEATGDNFIGRVVLTMRHMSGIDLPAILGLSIGEAAGFVDSGYVYIVYAGTIFSLVAFWLFVTLYPSGETPRQRRLAHALPVFLFLNLMIGATPIFTAKIAGLLWLLVGHAKFNDRPGRQPARTRPSMRSVDGRRRMGAGQATPGSVLARNTGQEVF